MLMTTDGRSLGTADERRNVKCRDPQNGHRSTDLVHLSYSVCPMSDTTVLHNRCSTSSLKVCELKSLLHGNWLASSNRSHLPSICLTILITPTLTSSTWTDNLSGSRRIDYYSD